MIATPRVKAHTAHMLTVATGDDEPKALAWCLTKGIEALLSTVEAIGVYWRAGGLVLPKEMFIGMSSESSLEYLPLLLWIDFRCLQEKQDVFSLVTTGMQSLGLMELEVQNSRLTPSQLVDKAYDLAHYLLDNGPVLKDGDTFGISADERIRVRHANSFVDRDGKVYRFEL